MALDSRCFVDRATWNSAPLADAQVASDRMCLSRNDRTATLGRLVPHAALALHENQPRRRYRKHAVERQQPTPYRTTDCRTPNPMSKSTTTAANASASGATVSLTIRQRARDRPLVSRRARAVTQPYSTPVGRP